MDMPFRLSISSNLRKPTVLINRIDIQGQTPMIPFSYPASMSHLLSQQLNELRMTYRHRGA